MTSIIATIVTKVAVARMIVTTVRRIAMTVRRIATTVRRIAMALLATPLLKTHLAMATVTDTTTTCMMITKKVTKI